MVGSSAAAAPTRPWTISDDIAVALFGDPYRGRTAPLTFSPDGNLVVAHIERGLLKANLLEDELRVYQVNSLLTFARTSNHTRPPRPIWVLKASTYSVGPLISQIRWTTDSKQLAFLRKTTAGFNQLVLADIREPTPEPLTAPNQNVTAYDLRDRHHYAFTVMTLPARSIAERGSIRFDTGKSFLDLLFPPNIDDANDGWIERSELWTSTDGPPKRVLTGDGHPVVLFQEGQRTMALSPDGTQIAAAVPVPRVPNGWERRFVPLSRDPAHTIHPGKQDLDVLRTGNMISEYAVVDLRTGKIRPIASAPTALAVGWWEATGAVLSWSDDGKLLALPSTFISDATRGGHGVRPCTAIADLKAGQIACIRHSKSYLTAHGPEAGFFIIDSIHFTETAQAVLIDYTDVATLSKRRMVYALKGHGKWQLAKDSTLTSLSELHSKIFIDQSLTAPPRLVVGARGKERAVWDPNPQLRDVAITPVVQIDGKDAHGRVWRGGLYLPLHFAAGHRYPLVLQTHGFLPGEFRPSGIFPTSFAARALASAGIMVLQLADCPIVDSPVEPTCQLDAYQAAVATLVTRVWSISTNWESSGSVALAFMFWKHSNTARSHLPSLRSRTVQILATGSTY